MRVCLLPVVALLLPTLSAHAVVRGSVVRNPNGLRQSIVWIESSREELWRQHGRFPDEEADLAPAVVGHLAAQVGVEAHALDRAKMPGGDGELRLMQRGPEFSI